jgi:hypothetical protein
VKSAQYEPDDLLVRLSRGFTQKLKSLVSPVDREALLAKSIKNRIPHACNGLWQVF